MVSKTTYKLRPFTDLELGEKPSKGHETEVTEVKGQDDDLELMEIPLSPTNYDQPPTPDHDPPCPFQAECEIMKVLDLLKKVSFKMVR